MVPAGEVYNIKALIGFDFGRPSGSLRCGSPISICRRGCAGNWVRTATAICAADAPQSYASSPSSGRLYSSHPLPRSKLTSNCLRAAGNKTGATGNRGVFTSQQAVQTSAAPFMRRSSLPPAALGGPYVAASDAYASAPVPVQAAGEPPYTLDAGDKLRVIVFGQDGITNSYTVYAIGKVNLPLIGATTARGLTNQQLAAAIAARLKQGFVREPHVTVEIEAYRPFFILGEVTTPGQYPYVANMTAETAVAIAGSFAPRASKDGRAHPQSRGSTDSYRGTARLSRAPRRHHCRQGAVVLRNHHNK